MVISGISTLIWLINSLIAQQDINSLFGLLQSQLTYIILIVMCDTLNFRLIDILRIKNYATYYMLIQMLGVMTTLYFSFHFVKNELSKKGILVKNHFANGCPTYSLCSGLGSHLSLGRGYPSGNISRCMGGYLFIPFSRYSAYPFSKISYAPLVT